MKIGELVVLVDDVDGVEAGREGCIMGLRDDMVTVGCQSRERLHLVLARTWQVLPTGALPPFEREGKGE